MCPEELKMKLKENEIKRNEMKAVGYKSHVGNEVMK